MINQPRLVVPTAVREIHIEEMSQFRCGLNNLAGYDQVFAVFRMRGVVVGQAWMPVTNGVVSSSLLENSLSGIALPAWFAASDEVAPAYQPTISVVVCTRDRTDDLARCLPGLLAIANQGHQVIVVDNAPSSDHTARLLAQYPQIEYVYEGRAGLDIARNRGIQSAHSEIVAFTDDDARVDAGWLNALRRNFADPMVAVVTGITMPQELETAAQLWFEYTNGFGRGFIRRQFDISNHNPLGSGSIGAGVNMAIRRDMALNHIGLFDEALDGGTATLSGGDQEFFYRVLSRGYRIVYEPAALVWHTHRREWESLRHTLYSYGVGLYAWWFRALLVEREISVLKLAPQWFFEYYIKQILKALLRRGRYMPRDLATAGLQGAIAGPQRYLAARRHLRRQAAQRSVSVPE
jgi:GT2 family glycosyltransferase